MPLAGDISLDIPELHELQRRLRELPDNLYVKHLGAAINKALKPGVDILKNSLPRGPTGNLRRSVGAKVKKYKRSLTVVGMVGYRVGGAKGKNLKGGNITVGSAHAYHQGLVEFGTKERSAKGRFASSFKTRGAFRLGGSKASTNRPYKYPRDFFKAAPVGQRANVGRVQGKGYVKHANDMAKDFMSAALRNVMEQQVENAWKDLARIQAGGRG